MGAIGAARIKERISTNAGALIAAMDDGSVLIRSSSNEEINLNSNVIVTGTLSSAGSFAPGTLTSAVYDKGGAVNHVDAFGALGDGATDDATAINAAITALPADGGTIQFGPKTYVIGAPITSSKSNVRLQGAGWSSVLKLKDATTTGRRNLVELQTVSGWVIADLKFDGNRAGNTPTVAADSWHGVTNTPAATPSYCTIEYCWFVNTARNAIWTSAGSYLTIRDCLVDGGGLYDAGDVAGSEGGIQLGSDHSLISGCKVTNWWKLIYIAAPDCEVSNNHLKTVVHQNDANGIEVYNPSTPFAYRCIVANNDIEDIWWEGVQVGTGADGCIVQGNEIRSVASGTPGTTNFGVYVNAPNVTVKGNYLSGWRCALYGETTGAGQSSLHAIYEGNEIVNAFTTAPAYGIRANDQYASVLNNHLVGCEIRLDQTAHKSRVAHNMVLGTVGGAGIILNALTDCLVEGNTVDGASDQGIQLAASKRCAVVGNVARGNGGNGIALFSTSDDCSVVGNVCFDNTGAGIIFRGINDTITGNRCGDTRSGGSKTQQYGIESTNTGESGTVVGNDVTGNGTQGVFFASGAAHRAALNKGYNPLGVLGPPAVPASTVAYTNAYNVDAMVYVAGGTVTAIAVGGVATGQIAGAFRVPAGSTIAITYAVVSTWVWVGD